MPKISKNKREKISEQIIFHLFNIFPKQIFTSDIAKELARDEEFTKKLLLELDQKGLVVQIDKNSLGKRYDLRRRWRLSSKTYNAYKDHQ